MLGTEHYVYRKDGRIWVYQVGRGDPVVLLHNFEMSSFIWDKVLGNLAQSFTCFCVDLPGHDRSDIPLRKYSVEDYSRAILDVMDACGLEKTHIIASHGGCVVAVDLAVTYPNRVKKLVFDGLPFWNKERGRLVFERFWTPSFTDKTSYDVPVFPLGHWTDSSRREPGSDRATAEKMEEISRRSRRWIRLSFEAMTEYDVEAAGPRIKAPTLLLYGERDALRRGEQRAKEAIKNSVHVVVPGSGAPHDDKPEEFIKQTVSFLKG